MGRRWWRLGAPILIAVLGVAYIVGDSLASPYPHPPAGFGFSQPGQIGVTRFVDIPIPAARERLSAHLAGARAVGGDGLQVRFGTTTADEVGTLSDGFDFRCSSTPISRVSGTRLNVRPDDTVLRVIYTPLHAGILRITGIDLDWRAGPFHGTSHLPVTITVHVSTNREYHYNNSCP